MNSHRHLVLRQETSHTAIRAQSAGGQHVNKTSSAIHLRFDIMASSLPDEVKQRLLAMSDQRLDKSGVITIKAQQFRQQQQNLDDALARLQDMVDRASVRPTLRRETKPTYGSRQRRLAGKKQRSEIKNLRGKVGD